MEIKIQEDGEITVLKIKGNIVGAPLSIRLSQSIYDLVENGKNKLVLDLSKVNWMNSAGIGLIVGGLTTLRNNGGDLKLACPSGKVKNLFDLTNISAIMGVFKSVKDAKQSFIEDRKDA